MGKRESQVLTRQVSSGSTRPLCLWHLSSLDTFLESQSTAATPSSTWDAQRAYAGKSKESLDKTPETGFRCTAAEIGFCFAMAMTQLLGEYLISGFSVLLPTLMDQFSSSEHTASNFWPASILSLILCSTILTFARVSDMYGGYPVFMAAVLWLFIWTLIAGFSTHSLVLLDICRAMQGLAIAAYTPSTFALFGSIYPSGPRRNMALGIFGACAPLGFYAGICISAALPGDLWPWYFWIAAIAAFLTLVIAYLSVPADKEDRSSMNLSMDWAGSVTITGGLILVAYSLASSATSSASWKSVGVLLPFVGGMVLLIAATYIEAKVATCPLLPFDFFKPKSVKPLTLACLFFYGCFGTWLFTSTSYLQTAYSAHGMRLAAWYTPMAVGGFLIAATSGFLLHKVSPTLLLLGSGCAWVAAPLLLALGKVSSGYWAIPFPSMICGTLGIDLTFTICVVFLSSVSPVKYQGLAGAVSSILVNMGIAFSLAFAQIVQDQAIRKADDLDTESKTSMASKAAFLFAAASAGVGVVIVALFVRVSKAMVDVEKPQDGIHVEPMVVFESRSCSPDPVRNDSMVESTKSIV